MNMSEPKVPDKPPFDAFIIVRDLLTDEPLFASGSKDEIEKFLRKHKRDKDMYPEYIYFGWVLDEQFYQDRLRPVAFIERDYFIPKA